MHGLNNATQSCCLIRITPGGADLCQFDIGAYAVAGTFLAIRGINGNGLAGGLFGFRQMLVGA